MISSALANPNTVLSAVSQLPPEAALAELLRLKVPDEAARLIVARLTLRQGHLATLKPLLPLLLTLKGKPYTLADHFPFEPFFQTHLARQIVLKTGRQVSKSTSLAAQGVIQSNCIPEFNALYITPLYEQIRRFSNNYVRPMIERSPARRLWTGTSTVGNVLERSFSNYSKMTFSFAFLDADRTRGVPTDRLSVDEIQDLDSSFLPILRECLSASSWSLEQFAGTPKTLDGTLEGLWSSSSQAEWEITCHKCGYDNIPALAHDLVDMIGPWHAQISEHCPGIVCAKCRKQGTLTPIFPRTGRWVHANPELRYKFPGYHVPQIIMPMHCYSEEKWMILLGKQQGIGNTSPNVFFNEVAGESYDLGAKLVTQTDLKKAGILHENTLENAKKVAGNYRMKILAIDWGGGGESRISFTSLAVLGLCPDGSIDCIYGHRSLTPNDPIAEALMILKICALLDCNLIAHDYNGAGALREQFLINAGMPANRIIPITYIRSAAGAMMVLKPSTAWHPRDYYQVDKARSLMLTCNELRTGRLKFFKYDHHSKDNAGLLHDFLALVEDMVDSRRGLDVHTIIRNAKMSDDFAQAVNYGCCAMWYVTRKWPNVAKIVGMSANNSVIQAMHPDNPDWKSMGLG